MMAFSITFLAICFVVVMFLQTRSDQDTQKFIDGLFVKLERYLIENGNLIRENTELKKEIKQLQKGKKK